MAFAPSLTSVDFSLSDFVPDNASLDMSTDDDTKFAANEEDFTSGPVEDSLDNSIITIIVSIQACLLYSTLQTLFPQVDDIHFRLDSHFLQRESETLKVIIIASENDSIHLKNVTAAEFRALRRFFYEG